MISGLTRHAEHRLRQRAIPPAVVEWLFEFGSSQIQNGAELVHFDKRARSRLANTIGPQLVGRLGNLLNTYAILSDGHIVTVGYLTKKIHRQ